jgi:hypothetical protein
MGQALDGLTTARRCFRDDAGGLQRGLLTSSFAPVVGLERIWHRDEMEDVGFALLTGGRRPPSRHAVGGWRRHLKWHEVDAFCRRTSPWHLIRGQAALVSYDDHTIPRWTHTFHIKKGYVTTRNQCMRCEKRFYSHAVTCNRYLSVRATPGNVGLQEWALPLIQQTLTCGQPAYLHAWFDAAAGASAAGVRSLWDLAAQTPQLNVTRRACRYPHRVRAWKALPSGLVVPLQEPGPYVAAPPKEIRLAETQTVLKDASEDQAVRTIICREIVPGPQKDRWHPLFTTGDADLLTVLQVFRQRQYHEQSYRVGVYDEGLDAVPCGYDKDSPDPQRPRFHRGPLQMMGWLVALVYNAVADLAQGLAGDFTDSHVRTLRRKFFNRPGQRYATPEALIVKPDPFAGQEALEPVRDALNAAGHRLPWLENRQLVMTLTPHRRSRASP